MKRIITLLFVFVLVCGMHECEQLNTGNGSNNNNHDPCQNPSLHSAGRVIPYRNIATVNDYVSLFTVNVTDDSGCLTMVVTPVAFSRTTPDGKFFSAFMFGTLYELCGGAPGTSFFSAVQQSTDIGSIIPSEDIQQATLPPLLLQGSRTDTSQRLQTLNITTGPIFLYANSTTYLESERDELITADNSPCVTRITNDDFFNNLYSTSFRMTMTLENGVLYSFTYPENVLGGGQYTRSKFYYHHCKCEESLTLPLAGVSFVPEGFSLPNGVPSLPGLESTSTVPIPGRP